MKFTKNKKIIFEKLNSLYYYYSTNITKIRNNIDSFGFMPKNNIVSYNEYEKNDVIVKIFTCSEGFWEYIGEDYKQQFKTNHVIKDMYKLHDFYISQKFKQIV